MNSFNHYSYGAVAEWMFSTMAGIKPSEQRVGFDGYFILAPMPDAKKRITNVKAKYRDVVSEWYYEEDNFVYHFIIPDGVALIEFPLMQSQKTVTINDITFTAKDLDGKIKGKKMIFELPAGEYIVK